MKRMLIPLVLILALASAVPAAAQEYAATIEDPDGHSNLRDKAGKIIGKVKAGERITAVRPEDGSKWWFIRPQSGGSGYVHESRIRLLQNPATPSRQEIRSGKRTPRAADFSISGIRLSDPDSTERVLGKNVKFVEEDNSFPLVRVLNETRTEQLELTGHYGGLLNEVREIQVRPVGKNARGRVLGNVKQFRSGKGIQLGLSEREIEAILGKPAKVTNKGGSRVWEYRVTDPEARYYPTADYSETMELYYGRYVFREGKLHEFEFGFEYP